jgi:hypothetical protein
MRELRNNELKIAGKAWRLRLPDAAQRFTQSGWLETEAEVLSCKDGRRQLFNNLIDGQESLDGWLVAFRYLVDGRSYDGVHVSSSEWQVGEKFPIRYNPAHPDQNDSLTTKLDALNDSVLWAYFIFLVLLLTALAVGGRFLWR